MRRRNLVRALAAGAVTLPVAGISFGGTARSAAAADSYRIAITDHVSNTIMVYDRAAADWNGDPLWSFSAGSSDGWNDPLEFRMRECYFGDEVGTLVMVAHGRGDSGRVGLMRLTSDAHLTQSDLIWTDHLTTYPHSIERVPDIGAIVIASTDKGGWLHLYVQMTGGDPSSVEPVRSYAFPEAHGVLWDPASQLLWASGGYYVRSYQVTGSKANVALKEYGTPIILNPYNRDLPEDEWAGNGHDIQPDYTDPNRLLVTDSWGCYYIDKSTRLSHDLGGNGFNTDFVKSFVRHWNGEYILTADPTSEDSGHWGGPTVYFLDAGGQVVDTRTCDGSENYKARIVTHQFQ